MKGEFVISLDFELHWGIFDKVNFEENQSYFENTRQLIPELLKLFQDYNIEVTWATVGMLVNDNYKDWIHNQPKEKPNYNNEILSAYNWVNNNKQTIKTNKLGHFAPELVQQIIDAKGQEMGSHTYAHYYCLDKGQTVNEFNEDANRFAEIAKKQNIKLESLVFPRNQYNQEYLEVCKNNGLKIVRANPNNWCWNYDFPISILQKIARTLDCYIPLFKTSFKKENVTSQKGVVLFPASRFLKPVSQFNLLNSLRIKRIKNEMTRSAKKGEFYHLWWHPHNFGNSPKQAIEELEAILKHYVFLKNTYKMKSSNMINVYKSHFSKNEE